MATRKKKPARTARTAAKKKAPARKRVSDEVLLRYNGMLSSVFELLADARAQIASINGAIDAQRDFWIADTELQFVVNGGSLTSSLTAVSVGNAVPTNTLPKLSSLFRRLQARPSQ